VVAVRPLVSHIVYHYLYTDTPIRRIAISSAGAGGITGTGTVGQAKREKILDFIEKILDFIEE
jgi:hypothetical protein